MLHTLIVSPHLDDAVLSCAGELIAMREREQPAAVLTLFSAGSRGHRVRRREDRAALAQLGAGALHAGLVDAPFRLRFERRPSLATLLSLEPDPADVEAARVAVAAVIAERRPARVLLPLGVGGHVDHRAAFLCHAVAPEALFYEDRPYAFVEALLAHRRHFLEGGRAARAYAAEEVRAQLADAPWADESAAAWAGSIASDLAEVRPSAGVRVRVVEETHHGARAAEVTAAIEAYQSQRRWLFGGHDVGAWWRARGGASERLVARSGGTVPGEMTQRSQDE